MGGLYQIILLLINTLTSEREWRRVELSEEEWGREGKRVRQRVKDRESERQTDS